MTADQGHDPRTGEPVGEPVPHTSQAELDRACRAAAAAAAVPGPAAMPPAARAGLLRAVATALADRAEELLPLADAETGLGLPG